MAHGQSHDHERYYHHQHYNYYYCLYYCYYNFYIYYWTSRTTSPAIIALTPNMSSLGLFL